MAFPSQAPAQRRAPNHIVGQATCWLVIQKAPRGYVRTLGGDWWTVPVDGFYLPCVHTINYSPLLHLPCEEALSAMGDAGFPVKLLDPPPGDGQ